MTSNNGLSGHANVRYNKFLLVQWNRLNVKTSIHISYSSNILIRYFNLCSNKRLIIFVQDNTANTVARFFAIIINNCHIILR